jgi:hypothetical protein
MKVREQIFMYISPANSNIGNSSIYNRIFQQFT